MRRDVATRQILSKACEGLREYYHLQEPCLVTKCYEASDNRFTNRDVCIFVVGNELCITANLQYGFIYGNKDLGCYAFCSDEISLSQRQEEGRLVTELTVGQMSFQLGKRAAGFIKKLSDEEYPCLSLTRLAVAILPPVSSGPGPHVEAVALLERE